MSWLSLDHEWQPINSVTCSMVMWQLAKGNKDQELERVSISPNTEQRPFHMAKRESGS